MDQKHNAFYEKYKNQLDIDNSIPKNNRPIIPYCKIDCLGNKLTYDRVRAAFQCTSIGRAGYSAITYDPFKYTIECENVFEFYLDNICDNFNVVVSFKKDD